LQQIIEQADEELQVIEPDAEFEPFRLALQEALDVYASKLYRGGFV
jgi:hypothetical protein